MTTSQLENIDCHEGKDTPSGHSRRDIGRHVARVACQSCHIPTYAKNDSDTVATEETEIHRDWQQPHFTGSTPIHPQTTMAGDLNPKYRWWDGRSRSYLLFDQVPTPITGTISTSEPIGTVDSSAQQLIALDTSVYFTTGDYLASTTAGLVNMGRDPSTPVEWVTTDTYQLITHEISPANQALSCTDCHDNTNRMDLPGELGFALKGSRSQVCRQCHGSEDDKDDPMYL